jgi:hypothetical protein
VIIVVNQSVHQIDGGNTFGDCDLYVKFGASPTKFDFDYKDTTNNRSFELVIPNALQDTLYIGIYGYQTCLYRVCLVVFEFLLFLIINVFIISYCINYCIS